jgi:mono/diheme cytochrome c family protein
MVAVAAAPGPRVVTGRWWFGAGRVLLATSIAIVGLVGCDDDGDDAPDGLSAEARRGAEIAEDSGCSACHRSEAVAPAFERLYGSTVELDDGSTVVADEEYLTRAITDPGADIVAGYAAAMPDNDLTDDEVASVVAYLRELGGSPSTTGPDR